MNSKTQLFIYGMFCVIFLSLSLYLLNQSKQYTCNQCVVEFKSYAPISNNERILRVNITNLYTEFQQNKCMVFWDETQGYMTYG